METILEHGWKEKSVKLPNLNVMFLKSNQDIALQSHRILKMFVWWGWGWGWGGGAGTFLSPYQRLKNLVTLWSIIFARFGHITFKNCKFSNFKVLFPAVSMDFWSLSKLKNTAEGSINTSCKK